MVKNILAAIDGSAHGRKTLDVATDLALRNRATLYLLRVAQETEVREDVLCFIEVEYREEAPETVYCYLIGDGILAEAEKEARAKGVEKVQSVVFQGDPARAIIEFDREKAVDVIVIGSHGLGGLSEMLLGSVSNKVCQLAECTCVIVK